MALKAALASESWALAGVTVASRTASPLNDKISRCVSEQPASPSRSVIPFGRTHLSAVGPNFHCIDAAWHAWAGRTIKVCGRPAFGLGSFVNSVACQP